MNEPRPLTQAQLGAVDALRRALIRCDREGVAICGMDNGLYAYRADDFDRLHRTGMDRDSGGW